MVFTPAWPPIFTVYPFEIVLPKPPSIADAMPLVELFDPSTIAAAFPPTMVF